MNDENELLINDEYMKWLQEFILKYSRFCNTDWDYNSEKISELDYHYIRKLPSFFLLVENYARRNYINIADDESSKYCEYYIIKNHDIYYEIGLVVGKGGFFYCQVVDKVEGEYVIDYKEIKEDRVRPKTELIHHKLELLSNLIYDISLEGIIPLEEVTHTTEETVKRILKNKNLKKQ